MEKCYRITQNVGRAKYAISFHDGAKTHQDGSPFFDIHIVGNKKKRDLFIKSLTEQGYVEQ